MTPPRHLDLRGSIVGTPELAPVAGHVRAGGLVAYPTETVYGFGGACTPEGVAALRRLKPREAARPFLALVRGVDDVAGLAWTDEARSLADVFWPGALTLVLADPARIFPDGVRSEAGAVAVRVSPHPLVAALLEHLGAPLTSTSANAPGGAPATSGTDALGVAIELGGDGGVWVLDVGSLTPSEPSTIVDFTGARPVVLRAGSVPVNRLRCALPEIHER